MEEGGTTPRLMGGTEIARPATGHRPLPRRAVALAVVTLLALAAALPAAADAVPADGPLEIRRVAGGITVDGDLSDPAWRGAARIDGWFETNPGDNRPPAQRNVAYLAYDDRFLYAAFELEDPDPGRIRAPVADRDNVPGYTDYAGVIVDGSGDGKTAQMFLANPRGVQYDAINSDAAGEDSAPDFFWDSAGRITATGWVLEMRIPFSSLRYAGSDGWGIMLYRNYPREFRYQHFTSRLPRDSSCFICNVRPLVGLDGLPESGHLVVAPYATGSQLAEPVGDTGTPLASGDPTGELGVDVKWAPNPGTVVDATFNPDFSQIESDVAQIAANERFALFFPERRPFFLEGVDLFSTPIRAVYTRSITQPRWGLRATGERGASSYTLLVGQDEGGGSVVIPGSTSSDLADQDFESLVAVGRWRRDLGDSYVSVLYSGREIDGGAYNRVLGPDFRWQPTASDTVSGQLLFSRSATPERPDLADEWDGRDLDGHAGELWWNRRTDTWDYFALYEDIADGFRADNGFVPVVGYREGYGEIGRSWHPEGRPVSRLRLFTFANRQEDRDGRLLERGVTPGFGLDSLLNSFFRLELAYQDVASGERVFRRRQLRPTMILRPGRWISQVSLYATLGDEIDFANDRLGKGATINLEGELQPTDHLQIGLVAARRWLDVDAEDGLSGRLFTADVGRLRATYNFNARSWLRLIGQWVEVERDPRLYDDPDDVEARSSSFDGSAVFAFKLDWQSVLYVGYAHGRELDDTDRLRDTGRQVFVKVSYAWQR